MNSLFKSFYAKITGIFLVLLVLLGGSMVYINYHSYTDLVHEAEQKLNIDLAEKMAGELESIIRDTLDKSSIKKSIHYMMVYNPSIEIYLLDTEGNILAYFADPPQKVKADEVQLQAIKRFIESEGEQYIQGPDPRNPGTEKPFSASEIQLPGQQGYLYIILGGQKYESAIAMARDSYIVRNALVALTGALIITGIVGVFLFFYQTKRIRKMAAKVERFERGNLEERISVHSDDEVGQLARSFNSMADSIESYIEQIKSNDRLRRELVANISHDLRSPLASVRGYLETILLKEDDLDAGERRKYLDIILKNTTVLSKLVEDLFELAKLEAKQVETKIEDISITELCQDIALKFRPEAEKKDIDLETRINPSLPFVKADISLMERAISNLLRNALQYTPEHGKVMLETEEVTSSSVRISVKDTGYGIDPDELPHIFNRFYRGNKNRLKGSSGLGLAIAQKIVELHDSEIKVRNRSNAGTEFYFRLSEN